MRPSENHWMALSIAGGSGKKNIVRFVFKKNSSAVKTRRLEFLCSEGENGEAGWELLQRPRWETAFQGGGVGCRERVLGGCPLTSPAASWTPAGPHSPGGRWTGPGLTSGRCCQVLQESPCLELVLNLSGVPGHTVGLQLQRRKWHQGLGAQRQGPELPGMAIPVLPALQGSIQLEAVRVPTSTQELRRLL